jgi:hypothetical protein
MMVPLEAIAQGATALTALGVLVAAWQLWLTKVQNATRFEDDLMAEYRKLIRKIPVKALLGQELTEWEFSEAYAALYHYIDLSNEEVFLRQRDRVTKKTWEYWRDGIKLNLSRPAFKKAWDEIKPADPGFFTELRRLERSEFVDDPKRW